MDDGRWQCVSCRCVPVGFIVAESTREGTKWDTGTLLPFVILSGACCKYVTNRGTKSPPVIPNVVRNQVERDVVVLQYSGKLAHHSLELQQRQTAT